MTDKRWLVRWMAAWFIGVLFNPKEVAGGSFGQSFTDEDSTPPFNPSAPMGLRGYRRYFANDSLIGRPVPCTRDDKICFRHNLVFDPEEDRCMPLWEKCGSGEKRRTVDRTELEHGSGRVLGYCPEYDDPCPGYRMAYDDRCYRKKIVCDVICGWNTTLSPHILGGIECRVQPTTLISAYQLEDEDSCVIPDFRTPDLRHSMLVDDPLGSYQDHLRYLDCENSQFECFTQNKIWVTGSEGCHTFLEQGPCAEDHVVALDRQATTEGRAEGKCVHVRGGCPKGYKRMLFDGQCHEDREIEIVAPGEIFFNEYGSNVIISRDKDPFYFIPGVNVSYCVLLPMEEVVPELGSIVPGLPPCGSNDMSKCNRYEVENDPPQPDISS